MRVIVVGAGHAGIEAAVAAAKLGVDVVLITIHLETVAQMSCNPSIGGIAKGHLVKEVDVLGGVMARVADATGIHFKTLNKSKGPAVRATRTQNDKVLYRNHVKFLLEKHPNIHLHQAIVSGILTRGNRVQGVLLLEGDRVEAQAVVITTGTFMNGKIYIGDRMYEAGRANEPASVALPVHLKQMGFRLIRLKTGTPMRLHADTIDWGCFEPQPGDEPPVPFSMFTRRRPRNRILCYLGHTTPSVKRIIEENLDRSPLFSGKIEGVGPRYCPSIEDKIVKFPHRDVHHFYLEPEGIENKEIYVNGLSSSLPIDVQRRILSVIPGLDRAFMMRPAYAIEYDAVSPTQLNHTLESKEMGGLYFAGQVNGTSGYEEAAAQGLVAGTNAALRLLKRDPMVLTRESSYTGVMVDDIVTKGIDEPYRLFTSRAECRLQLREDNAFERLGNLALRHGLLERSVHDRQMRYLEKRKRTIRRLREQRIRYRGKTRDLYHLLKMPEMSFAKLEELMGKPLLSPKRPGDVDYIEATIKYEGYIQIQNLYVEKMKHLQEVVVPADIDYSKIDGLSSEVRQKLTRRRPVNLREALAIPGVTPASINAIRIYLTLKHRV